MARKKTWTEKLKSGAPPHNTVLEKPFAGVPAGAVLHISSPSAVADWIGRIPKGETRTILDMRKTMASKARADATCPTTSSIFVRIAAEAALEGMAAGKPADEVTPFWRLVEPGSAIAERLSCPPEFIAAMRATEQR